MPDALGNARIDDYRRKGYAVMRWKPEERAATTA